MKRFFKRREFLWNGIAVSGLFMTALFFFSCTNELSDILMRTTQDPFKDSAKVDFMSESGVIHLSWKNDEGADEYILTRAEDSAAPLFTEIYRGSNREFCDRSGSTWTKYIYRLDKKRGKKVFKGDVSYGFCSGIVKDSFENNDIKERAMELLEDRKANVYSASFTDGKTIMDEDWYYVEVPGNRKAEVILYDEDLTGETDTVFCYSLEGTNPKQLSQNGKIVLVNESGESRKLYFKITPVQSGFTGSGESFVRSYQLKLQSISKQGD